MYTLNYWEGQENNPWLLQLRRSAMSSKLSGRRRFLRDSAALVGLAAGVVPSAGAQMSPSEAPPKDNKDLIAYGERSHYVKSVRIPVMERMSPDDFEMTFHVLSPLQDSVGIITASSLHYVATHRGSYVPDINPQEHRLMIHGMVDRPLIFTVEELKRLPYVTRTHFLECSGNRAKATHKTVQQTHGMTSCCEWTGVPLSLLLKEAGVQSGASFIVAEGAETVKGATSIPLAKAMDDCLVCYGQNGEAVRPQHGFPLRLIVPGYEGIHNIKYLRRIKVVEQHYMTYNDYDILPPIPVSLLSIARLGRNRSSPFLPESKSCPAPDSMKSLAWLGRGRVLFAPWTSRSTAGRPGRPLSFGPRHIPWRTPVLAFTGRGTGRSA